MSTFKDKASMSAWLHRVAERKAKVHPEHPTFISTCERCIAFRASLFTAN